MQIDPFTAEGLRLVRRRAWLVLALALYGWVLVILTGATLGYPKGGHPVVTVALVLSLPSLALWWVFLLWSAGLAFGARKMRKDIERGEWRRLPCRVAASPTGDMRSLLVSHAPDQWRAIDSIGLRRMRVRHLEGCTALDVLYGETDGVVYRVPEIAALHRGKLGFDLAHDHSRAAIEELAEHNGVAIPKRPGRRTPSSEPLLVFHRHPAASTIFNRDGRRIGHVEHAATEVTVYDNDGAVVVRVRPQGSRTRVVTDGHGAELACVERPFYRSTWARVTDRGSVIATLRGDRTSFLVLDRRGTRLAEVRVARHEPSIVAVTVDPREPLAQLVAAGPWIGLVLDPPSD